MSCTDRQVRAVLAGVGLMAGCSLWPSHAAPSASDSKTAARATVSASTPATDGAAHLPPPIVPRNLIELRAQAALRLVAANPGGTYTGEVPEILLAIPVLEIELNGDGSVRKITVLRYPRQARDTVKIATDAVRRAAPFGDVSRLPRPWRFTETFLFDDDRKFKPRTLDQ